MITGEQTSGFTTERKPARQCYIVVGNHGTYHGIGEILYTLHHFFSRRYTVYFSLSVIPDNLNIIIDEFANQELPQYLAECKRNRPKTRFVIVATEFVTEMSVAGISFGNTFNYFNLLDDWKHLLRIIMYRYGLKSRPPYMFARYQGFAAALASADLVLCVHPSIRETMALIPAEANVHAAELLDIYPEVDVDKITSDRRLIDLPAGFVTTGTLTKYRAGLITKLRETFTRADIPGQVHQHLPFGSSPGFTIVNQAIKFEYDDRPLGKSDQQSAKDGPPIFLFNLNPPQRRRWGYSSPMRILRAVLLGQVPVVTNKFGDHEIESLALVWDGQVETAQKMWVNATIGRRDLIRRHQAALIEYNRVAHAKNAVVDHALDLLG